MKYATLLAAAGFIAMSVSASAQTASTGIGSVESEYIPISENLLLVNARVVYTDIISDDMSNPLLNATGVCSGAILINAGAVSGGGYCHYTDTASEQVVISWTADALTAEGRTLGDWSVVGGTGPWKDATGGGRFDAGTDADGNYTNNVTGEFMMN
jgi:hypothetical protein